MYFQRRKEAEDMPFIKKWNRNIDKIELYGGSMKVICSNGAILIGECIGNCLGTDSKGEDVEGVRFETQDGKEYDLIEADIKQIEYLDGEPE